MSIDPDRIHEADPDECECGECDYCYDKKHAGCVICDCRN